MKILVVEDDFTSRNILIAHLQEYGTVAVAVTGVEGQEAISGAITSGEPYNLVCLDLTLPGTSGIELLHMTRTLEKIKKSPPAVILITTGDHSKETVLRTMKEGCNGYLVKPYNPTSLEQVLKQNGISKMQEGSK